MRPIAVAILALFSVATEARDPSAQTRIFVPDTGNNRVLIYNAPTANGQSADVVLGQGGFDTNQSGTSATTMSSPTAAVTDAAGELIVSDTNNCRLLVFKPPFTSGKAASAVIGKTDFETGCPPKGPVCGPGICSSAAPAGHAVDLGKAAGLAIDIAGGLWVADTSNNRVLHFMPPFVTGAQADAVIGQTDFESTNCPDPATPASLCSPIGVATVGNTLWISDRDNNRVLGYLSPTKQPSADVMIGHDIVPGATSLSLPTDLAFDQSGALWVADTGHNRVLAYAINPKMIVAALRRSAPVTGVAPLLVIGQSDFNSTASNRDGPAGPATLSSPQGIEPRGNAIWIGDTSNNRTLKFAPPYAKIVRASLVLGQPDFTSTLPNQDGGDSPSARSESAPFNSVAATEAGSSALALAVLIGLTGAWLALRRLRRKTA